MRSYFLNKKGGNMRQTILKTKRDFHKLKERFCSSIERLKEALLIVSLFILCLPCLALARDFLASVENASNQIRQIIAMVGVLALMIAGVCFYWSKRLGMEKLSAAIIGTVVFAAASTIFTLFYRAFN